MYTDKGKLVAGCQQKDPKAMKRLYDELAPKMLGVCMRYTHSRDEAQDLLHDGFIKAFESIGELKNPMALESWMTQIMVNLSINYVTRDDNLCYSDLEMSEGESEHFDDEELDLDRRTTLVEDVVKALQALPYRYRAAFSMKAVEEMEYGEIAALFNKSEATVRRYVDRARQLIIENLNMKGKQI